MRPASSRVVTLRITVLCLLATLIGLNGLASAQAAARSKSKVAHRAPVAGSLSLASSARPGAPPPVTTDTWQGGASGVWSTPGNWNNGAITSGENILINLTTAATTDDVSYTIGTLTLSNAGDSVSLNNNIQTTVTGNISNAGTITFNAAGNITGLFINNPLNLSGSGSIVLTSSNGQYTGTLYGTTGAILTTSSNITGAGTVGNGELNFVNSGTMNANISGQSLLVNPDTCVGCTNSNTGTLEATGGGTLILSNGTWTNTGVGKITAAASSAVDLQGNVSITGGTLSTTGSGVINNVASNNVFLTNVTNTGNYVVQNNGATEISGTLTNTGTMTMNAAGNVTELYLTGNTTLSGSGTVVLSSTNNQWTGQISGVSGSVLTNQSTINGWGAIGTSTLQIANASNGVINSNLSGGNIELSPLGTVTSTNAGLMEATNGGTLTMNTGTWTNTGTIEAATGSSVALTGGVSITGGTIESVGTGTVFNAVSNNVFLTGLTLAGTYDVQNNAATEINGTITNNGVINLQATGNVTELYVTAAGTGSATLAGTGSIVLGTGTGNQFSGASGTSLTIDQGVSGVGNIGTSLLTLTNNSTIDANISPTVSTIPLTIQPGTGGMINTHILEATNGGNLTLLGGSINNAGGTIEALGSDTSSNPSTVVLTANVTVTGGTLTTTGAGIIEVAGSNNANLTGLTNSGTLNVQNNGQIVSSGTITNNGTITLQAAGNSTYFYAPNATTLSGSGSLVLSSTNGNYTGNVDAQGGLTNGETITGAGQIDTGSFTNNGTVNANVSGQTLLLQSLTTATNTKTMEATNGGTMEFNGSNWTNTGGTISAQTGSAVELTGSASITGGTLTTSGTGQIFVLGSNVAFLSGLTNSGTINVQNNAQLELTGAITNSGTITLQAAGNTTYLLINGAVTLNGSGIVNLSSTNNNFTNNIFGVGTTPTLTSFNTIEGAGNLGSSNMGFTNNGTLDANVAGLNLAINVDSSGFTNYNGSNFTLTGGTYIANGGNITFASGGTTGITTLSANVTEENGGQILDTSNGNANALAKLTSITSTGALTIGGPAFIDAGSFSNAGSLTILGGESFTVGSLAQISGGSLTAGTYVLDANLNLSGAAQTITTNATNLTLAGGTIHNNTGGTNALAGLAFNTKNLTIAGASNNVSTTAASFSNTGTLTINGSDSFTAGNLTQISSGTLTAGTYVLGGNLDLTTSGISITKNSATLTLQGGTINSNGVNALSALAFNTSKLTIAGSGTNVSTSAASFSNTGTLTINSGDSFTATTLTQLTGANNNKTLTAGTYVLGGNLDLTTSGLTITKNSATLTLQGGTINSNGVNALGALATNTGKLTIAGTGNNVSTTAASFSNTGTLTINAGDSFIAPALTQISGSTLTAGTFVLGGNLDLAATANITTNSANLTLEGGTIQTGSTNDLANLSSNTNALTLASNANFTAVGNFTNSGALTINKGSKFSLTGTNLLTNLSAGTLGSGTYTIGGTLQLTTANGGITTNAANLTLTGTGFSIKDGTANALAGFNNNTGTFALASAANFTTGGNFTDSGTATIAKGTKLTIGGTNNTYTQSAGTTNLDGTLAGGNATVTGGLFQGAGTVSKNLTIGGVGTAPTLNVGDAGKTGLLAITGTYTQLSTGTMTGLINGTTAGTGFSQLNVTGTAALAGTINFTVAAGFQGSLFLGETFTVLNAASITGSFSNSTIAINSSFHFTVTYTSTGVVLTVASGPVSGPSSSPAQPVAQMAMVTTKPAANQSKSPVVTGGLSQRTGAVGTSKIAKPIFTAGLGHSNAIIARSSEISGLRSWEHLPVNPITAKPITVARIATPVNSNLEHNNIVTGNRWVGGSQAIAVHAPLAGSMANYHRVPVKSMPLSPPRIMR